MSTSTPKIIFISVISIFLLVACVRPSTPWKPKENRTFQSVFTATPAHTPTQTPHRFATRDPNAPLYTPTPDAPHVLPTLRSNEEQHVVQRGETLGTIAQKYGVDINAIVTTNQISNPDLLAVGQVLTIPAPEPLPPGPSFKIIPDSELVNSPSATVFDAEQYIIDQGGFLSHFYGEMEGNTRSGADILMQVARDYSVHPRILLAVLEHQSGWVTQSSPPEQTMTYPMGYFHSAYDSLYFQLAWAANNLNRGYYLWKAGAIAGWILADGAVVPPSETINPGTAAVQHFFSLLEGKLDWEHTVGPNGLFATYMSLFGYPFDYALEPLVPHDLVQPEMQLPFEQGAVWSFTGGPHGGWGNGSAWAAIDFAPPGEALGCVANDAWVVASATGPIVRSENGAVVQDLDRDGFEQTGWTMLYMHIESRDRVQVGDFLDAGERVGHPSCEGGVSSGTHVHMARRYNGEWIPADSWLPFNLDGWISGGNGIEYDGWLNKNGQTVEAWNGRQAENQIYR